LIRIEANALSGRSSLASLHFPASLEGIGGSVLACTRISDIIIDDGNCHFRVSEDFLLDIQNIYRFN
jgi:hypothetical protein